MAIQRRFAPIRSCSKPDRAVSFAGICNREEYYLKKYITTSALLATPEATPLKPLVCKGP